MVAPEHLGGHERDRARQLTLQFTRHRAAAGRREVGRGAKVGDLERLPVLVDEQVAALEVAVEHVLVVEVRQARDDLLDEPDDHRLREGAVGRQQRGDRA